MPRVEEFDPWQDLGGRWPMDGPPLRLLEQYHEPAAPLARRVTGSVLPERAITLAAAGYGPEAIAALRDLADTPEAAEAWSQLGMLLHGHGDIGRAEEAWRVALMHAPRLPSALVGLAGLLEGTGRRAEAKALLAGDGEDPPQGIIAEQLGALHLADGDAVAAEVALRAAVAGGDATDGAWYALGDALRIQARRAEAVTLGRDLVALRPGQSVALAWLGVALMEAGEHGEGADCLATALQAPDPPNWARIRHAEALCRAGRKQECIEATYAALKAEPGVPALMAHAGYLLRRVAAEEQAVMLFAEAMSREPLSEAVRMLESASLFEERRFEEAAESARLATLALPDRGDLFDRLGHILLDLEGRETEAAAAFSQATALIPRHVRAWAGLCEAERRLKRLKEAVAAFRMVSALNADKHTVRNLRYRLFGELD